MNTLQLTWSAVLAACIALAGCHQIFMPNEASTQPSSSEEAPGEEAEEACWPDGTTANGSDQLKCCSGRSGKMQPEDTDFVCCSSGEGCT